INILVDCSAAIAVEMDAPLLGQAVVNLLGNAIKYSAENSRVEINCAVRENSGVREAVIMIRDYGPGIAAEHLKRIFERFYRCDKSRSRRDKQGGTGLGLAIVKHIMELHHGGVSVESHVGRGSTFIMALPMV
ncbi:MAG: GHKL domain-containing protein, partial [Deltaproteobacteria bacterium]|nr:GHKL domain-containing protein [Deltaproteobacteria bacterium]